MIGGTIYVPDYFFIVKVFAKDVLVSLNRFISSFVWQEATATFQKAIDIYTEMGRYTIAAKHHQGGAE